VTAREAADSMGRAGGASGSGRRWVEVGAPRWGLGAPPPPRDEEEEGYLLLVFSFSSLRGAQIQDSRLLLV
jgi:hypothetical protein